MTGARAARRVARHLAVATVLLTAAACASDDDGASEADTPEPATTDETAEQPSEPTGDESDDADSADADGGDGADDAGVSDGSTETTVLQADESADLPTVRPEDAAPATTVPGPLPVPSIQLIEEAGYDQPIDATVRPGDNRMLIIEKGGRVIAADAESSTTILDMSAVAATAGVSFTADGGEQGLLGVAYHPSAPLVYAHFTGGDGATVVAELAIDPSTAEAEPATYRELLRVPQPFANHNGGELEFGPDGLLYLALGDGGSANDPERAGLDLSSPLGSILRFDPNPSEDGPITVPADNPYADGVAPGGGEADPLIWSSGLRNPWKFSWDPVTGDLWIADVGQGDFEEINRALADPATGTGAGRALDFGWSAFEAYSPFNDDQSSPAHTPPTAAYPHENGDCSVSGGVVARDSSYGDLNGWYVYGDFCSGRLWALDTTTVPDTPGPEQQPTIVELGTVPALTSVFEGPDGDIYAVSITGPVFRLAPA